MEASTIIPLTPNRQAEVARLFARTYQHDPSVVTLLQGLNEKKRIKLLAYYWNDQIAQCITYGSPIALIHADRLVGARLLYLPGQYPVPVFTQWVSVVKFLVYLITRGISLTYFIRLAGVTKQLERIHPTQPYLYDELTCIDFDYQDKSLYTLLQRHLFDLANRCNVGIYCETSNPKNIPRLVDRFGFKVSDQIEVNGITYWSLWRPATTQRHLSKLAKALGA